MFSPSHTVIIARLSRGPAIARAIAFVLLSFAASWPASAHIIADGFEIQAEWVGLEARDAELVTRRPVLFAALTNRESGAARVSLQIDLMLDGRTRQIRHAPIVVEPGKTVRTRVRLRRRYLRDLEFSGRLSVTAIVESVAGHQHYDETGTQHAYEAVGLPSVWFHPDRRRLRFYREDVLRDRYGGGNFRGGELRVYDSTADMQEAIARTIEQSSRRPVLAHIAHGGGTSGGIDNLIPPGSRKFCLVMDGIAYIDSSRSWKDFGEDFGRAGTFIPLSRAWVALGQDGSPLFTGFLDGAGCTPNVVTNTTDPVSVAFIPMAHNPFDNRLFVSDLNLGPEWPDSMPFFLLFFDVVDAPVNFLEMDSSDFVQVMFSAAANCLERAPGGMTDTLYEFQARAAGDNSGTTTNYGDGGHPRVQVKFVPGAQSKFTLCHEYAHAINIADLAPPLPLNPTGLDYSVSAAEPEQHTLTSKEWNLVAAIEGFGHFVSATVWNDVSTGADGVYVSGGATTSSNDAFALDTFDQLFLTNFGAAGNPGQGVEMDWAQLFWAWRTDNAEPQNVPTMVEIWYQAYPWPVNQGFYAAFESAADTVLSDQDELDRLIELRIDAGIVP